MSKKSVLTEGYPTVKVAGKTYTLEPTLKAVRQICGAYGGILSAFQQVGQVNPGVSAAIIVFGAGINLKEQEEIDAFEEAVWRTPRSDYANGITKYLGLLLNGGKPPEEETEDDNQEPKKEADQGNG